MVASTPSPADEPISVRIAAAMPTLTPIHRRMGAFVLANLFRSATMRIDELASAVGASVATANRFARALGFDGYPAFREALVRGFEATIAPVERLRTARESPASGTQVFDASLEQAASNLQMTRSALDGDVADALVEAILEARRVFVLGYGASAFLAGLMEHGLTPYCANVQSLALTGGPSHAARRLFNASRGDLLVAIAFPRYVDDTIELARLAAGHGVRVVALTDSAASPLAQFADLVLTIRTERRLAANCDTAVLAVIEAICDAVAHRAKRSVEAASGLTEFVLPWLVKPSMHISQAITRVAAKTENSKT
jgi:DNA-binding MurR/RpiR family transcriptional regulator